MKSKPVVSSWMSLADSERTRSAWILTCLWFNLLLAHDDVDGVEFDGGEVGAGYEEEAGDEAEPELAGLHAAVAVC